jgi:hypothetical protein
LNHCISNRGGKVGHVKKPLVLAIALAGVVIAALKRRRGQADAALWREATSDSSR